MPLIKWNVLILLVIEAKTTKDIAIKRQECASIPHSVISERYLPFISIQALLKVHTYIHTYVCTYIHTYILAYMHAYIHTYTKHTFIHTYIQT